MGGKKKQRKFTADHSFSSSSSQNDESFDFCAQPNSKQSSSRDQFLGTPVKCSPGRSHGNLTGIPRKIKDNVADFYNAQQEWNKTSVSAINVIREIINIKLDFTKGTGWRTQDGDDEVSPNLAKLSNPYPDGLIKWCDKLEESLQILKRLLLKMQKLTDQLSGLKRLSNNSAMQYSDETTSDVIFLTWGIERFCITFDSLLKMYSEEFKLKKTIKETICHTTNEDLLNFQLIAWTHQPYIDDSETKVLIESMLLETGHREIT